MQKHVVVTKQRIRNHLITGFLAGTITAMFAWGLWSLNAIADQDKVAASEASIVSSCRLPDVNGAMTVFVMEDGKMKCWRWK